MPGAKYRYKIFLGREEGYWDSFGYDAAGLKSQLLTKYEQPMECLMSAHKVTVKTEKVHVKDFV